MRLARYFPPVVVGLASFICYVASPLSARAWNSPPAEEISDDSYLPNSGGSIVDDSVEQAGYYDSRPQVKATAPAAGVNQGTPANRKGALFHGQLLKMPSLPFGRHEPANRASFRPQQAASQRVAPNGAQGQQQRVANQVPQAGRPTQQRVAGARPMAANSNNINNQQAFIAANRPPQPVRQAGLPHPTALTSVRPVAPNPTRGNVSPAPRMAPLTVAPAKAAISVPAAPLTPADRLIAEAHELSTSAKSEQELTHIIETCRRAQASQATPATAQYANKLTAWAFNRRGQLKAEAGQDKEAILDFDDAIRLDANCWRAIHNRGVLLAQAGQFEKAFDDFNHTIQLNPKFAKAYSNRAALFMVADNLNSALHDYQCAIELDANLAVAHRGCGRVCQLLGRMDDAVVHYDAAVQLAPNDAYAVACRADLLTDIGRYNDAVAEYDRAIEIDPKSSRAHSGSAWLLATCPDSSVRNSELAIKRAQTAIELNDREDAVSFDTLAAAQASAGDFTSAMESIRKAIELAPADERDVYKDRLLMYQKAKPYRIGPVEREVHQASLEAGSGEPPSGYPAGSKKL